MIDEELGWWDWLKHGSYGDKNETDKKDAGRPRKDKSKPERRGVLERRNRRTGKQSSKGNPK